MRGRSCFSDGADDRKLLFFGCVYVGGNRIYPHAGVEAATSKEAILIIKGNLDQYLFAN